MTAKAEHSIAIVVPNIILAEGLKRVLERGPFALAVHWRSMAEALEETNNKLKISLIIIVVNGGPLPAYAQLEVLREAHAGARIVVMLDSLENPAVFGPMALNVDGVVLQSANPDTMTKCLELIALGERFFPVQDPDATRIQASRSYETSRIAEANALDCLTEREREVLEALAHGAPNKTIARQLEISDATVKVHVKAILRKTGARNRTEAALWAHGAGGAGSSLHG